MGIHSFKRKYMYQGVRKFSFSEKILKILDDWSLSENDLKYKTLENSLPI